MSTLAANVGRDQGYDLRSPLTQRRAEHGAPQWHLPDSGKARRRRGVAGGPANAAADGARWRFDGDDAVDDHGAGQPAGCDVGVVVAYGGAAAGADGDGSGLLAERGTVEAFHGVASSVG